MRRLFFLALCVLVVVGILLVRQNRRPSNELDSAPSALFDHWVATDGPHVGSRLWIGRSRVELANSNETLEQGPLLSIFSVPSDGGFQRYRLEFGSEGSEGALTVMLDARGNLRLANQPTSTWVPRDELSAEQRDQSQ